MKTWSESTELKESNTNTSKQKGNPENSSRSMLNTCQDALEAKDITNTPPLIPHQNGGIWKHTMNKPIFIQSCFFKKSSKSFLTKSKPSKLIMEASSPTSTPV